LRVSDYPDQEHPSLIATFGGRQSVRRVDFGFPRPREPFLLVVLPARVRRFCGSELPLSGVVPVVRIACGASRSVRMTD
jgi:hypothetical protein